MITNRKKVTKGQFYTKDKIWLQPQIIEFIKKSNCKIAYDPFAGAGDLIKCSELYGINNYIGKDIDENLVWDINDSLQNIPHIDEAIIITNPPYLSNYSASRKKVMDDVKKYFDNSKYDDLYLIALDRMLEAQDNVVAIIPETFINSNYAKKNRLVSITVLEDNPFKDTDTPVCVACFNNVNKSLKEIKVFKNNVYIKNLEELDNLRLRPNNTIDIKFNVINGWLGLRAVDTTNPENMLKFDYKENFDYDWNKGIKVSSRLLSTIDIDIKEIDRNNFINLCNKILNNLRLASSDIIFSPFKGNMKNGVRRRRLDFYTARAIMEKAYFELYGHGGNYDQLRIF